MTPRPRTRRRRGAQTPAAREQKRLAHQQAEAKLLALAAARKTER
jgi:hypothetical protein